MTQIELRYEFHEKEVYPHHIRIFLDGVSYEENNEIVEWEVFAVYRSNHDAVTDKLISIARDSNLYYCRYLGGYSAVGFLHQSEAMLARLTFSG